MHNDLGSSQRFKNDAEIVEDSVPHVSLFCKHKEESLDITPMFNTDDNYLPRFVSAYGNQLDHLLGDTKLTTLGYFGTLRFNTKSKPIYHDYDFIQERLTDSAIEQNWEAFFKIINKKLLKNIYRGKRGRRKKELPTLAVVEDHSKYIKLSHIHFIMLKPENIPEETFIKTIKHTWSKTYFGNIGTDNNPMFDIQKIFNRGVIPYVFKEKFSYSPYG